jgi:spore coat protein U-like protein
MSICPYFLANSLLDMNAKLSRAVAAAMVAFAFSSAAWAGTATGNLTVSATVAAGCQISSIGGISFGSYDPLNSSPNDAAGNIVFRCVKGTSYKTYISGTRTMTGGGNLSFQLYSDSNRTTVYPNTNSGTGVQASSNSPVTQNVYGRIAALQDVTAANYSATLIATVEY